MSIKKSSVFFVAVLAAALFLHPTPTQATFTHDFLYKFQSRWSDMAVNNAGTRVFIINESYSRIEEYNSSGVLQALYGNFGTGNTEFKRPQGIAIDASNMLYVLDTGNNRVVRYNIAATFTYDTQWGSYGTTDVGTFNNPTGIATDGTSVYIADTDNNRIQKCAGAGPATTCEIWGSLGIADGTFSSPKGITYASSLVYVADTGNNRIQIFNTSGVFQAKFGSYGITETANGSFVLPYRLAIDDIGPYIYILDNLNRIQRFVLSTKLYSGSKISLNSRAGGMWVNNSTTTLYVASFPTTLDKYGTNNNMTNSFSKKDNDIGRPVDMALDSSDNIYINNNLNENALAPSPAPVVQKFNSSFVQQNEWTGVAGFTSSATTGPMGIGSNTGNEIYVADTDANKLQKFNSLGSWIDVPTPAAPIGAYNSPKDVASEATGKYYVADSGNARIVKYDPGMGFTSWQLVAPTAGGPTIDPILTPEPYGITVASDNTIYVADYGYSRIQSFNANGTFIKSWGQFGSADNIADVPQLDRPQGMAIDSSNYIFVADTYNSRIQRFNNVGGDSTMWGEFGTGDSQFDIPRNVAVNTKNQVLVSEVGNKRIQVFGVGGGSDGVAGITIVESGGTNIAEGIDDAHTVVDTYTVQLKSQPEVPKNQPNTPVYVYVDLSIDKPTQAYVATPRLTFDQYNWNVPQTVTVIPIHDFIANGTHDVIITHTASSTNTFYANLSPRDVTAHITDSIDTIGVTLQSGYTDTGTSTWIPHTVSSTVPWATEGATLASAYLIKLNSKPTADVTITLTPDTSMTLSKTVFTFTSTNFNTPQFVTITPVHDFVAQGQHTGLIHQAAASSADPNYTLALTDMAVTIQDIDTVGITLVPATALSVNETGSGASTTYTVALHSKPAGEVQVALADGSGQVTMSPTTLTFLTTTWDAAQTVTVAAVHDFLKNSPSIHDATIAYTLSSSLDTAYDGLAVSSTTVHVTDTDTTGLLIFKPGGGSVQVTEGGATDSYAFQLTSIPSADVTVAITSVDGQATTSASLYTFTPSNWNAAQYATVSAIDNTISDGTRYGVFLHTLTSSDTDFNNQIAYQTAIVTDNDIPGITISLPNGTINIAEAGPTDYYFVRLDSQPISPVSLVFGAQNQATASPANLVFDSNNWNVNQEVVITAIQDYIVEGPTTATVSYTGVSADLKYSGTTASFVANITDDDNLSPGISVVETDGSTSVTKDTTTDTYTLALTSKPSANVKIKIISSGPEATTSAGIFWFTPSVWNVPQTVTVLAKTNPVGGATNKFSHLVWSLDQHYNGISAPTVTVTVNENRLSSPSAANAKAPTCGMSPPYSAPNLFQITTTQTEATLYFSPLSDNVSYYFIAYGFSPGDQRFGTSFEMGPYNGVINYTVSMLTPGTTYYFAVRGGNGCATGPWSGSVPATAVGTESSVTTTRTYYAPVIATNTSGSTGSSYSGGISLTRDLYPGSQGADVRSLQQYLNSKGFILATSGVGSPGNETTYYGNLTAAAVRRFQEAHFAEILSPLGYASGTGICGPSTRNYINSHP